MFWSDKNFIIEFAILSMLVYIHTYSYMNSSMMNGTMMNRKIRFGDLLKQLIKEAGYTQSKFYTLLGIKKPYFYDIISGRVSPPPSHLQFKALEILNVDENTTNDFFNLAAEERGELPADITQMITDNPETIAAIRRQLRKINEEHL